MTQKIIEKEFALSGSEQNPDLTGKSIPQVLSRVRTGVTMLLQAFMHKGEDFVVAETLEAVVAGMNKLTGENLLDFSRIKQQISARDAQLDNKFSKDLQITAMRGAQKYRGDRLIRVAAPHKLLDRNK